MSILKLTTTRRETKFYLNKYSTYNEEKGVNEGPHRAVIIKLRGNVIDYDEEQLSNFSNTLDYIKRLGASPVILLDPDFLAEKHDFNFSKMDQYIFQQFSHLHKLLTKPHMKLTPLRTLLRTDDGESLKLEVSDQLLETLADRHIPVLFPYVTDKKSKEWVVASTNYLANLVPELHKLNTPGQEDVITVEKVIFIDTLGGIPSVERSASHVFINLNQEYERISAELHIGHLSIWERHIHETNLTSMKRIIDSVSYPDLTGLITTLKVAGEPLDMNPIIYNILTDRTLVSSSLPAAKYVHRLAVSSKVSKTTIIRKGLQVREYTSFDNIDLTKFKALIDDSFKRTLDLDHYLKRIKPILSRIIIVGDYDGIAIVTTETAPSSGITVPYLDKFAISRNAQGSLGVADVIFNLLKRTYNQRLLWRSKKANPVNGWYFQRSHGSLGMDDTEFRVFWRGADVSEKELEAFVEIGRMIQPSWEK
ncbi:Amino-acid acetyltransferase, mitochondrial [Cyberlindnera fabianii]|nr:Amino-acid acetyltransferase, mitochondrial [Cyberlindnera fabianii]